MIILPPLGDDMDELWGALLGLCERVPRDWTLVGGQMVLLHGLERGAMPARVSQDLDLVVDLRVRPNAMPKIVEALTGMGFDLADIGADEFAHRFTRGGLAIDVMVPEGLGERTDTRILGTVEAVSVSGGTVALQRTSRVAVRLGDREGLVPRPDLGGALLIKSRAATSDRTRGPERHLTDLAFLYALVPDPLGLRDELSNKQRAQLGTVTDLADSQHVAWRLLGDDRLAADAHAAFMLITGE